jgi:hypothetical protein
VACSSAMCISLLGRRKVLRVINPHG